MISIILPTYNEEGNLSELHNRLSAIAMKTHHHDFEFLRQGRVPTKILPAKYQERLDRTRQAQGLGELFPEEKNSVPVMWVIIDLHNGAFFGGMAGRIFYDLLGGVLALLSVTGIYMYFRVRHRTRW